MVYKPDWVYQNGIQKDISIKANLELSSDHSPIIINANNKVVRRCNLACYVTKEQIGIFSANKREVH